MSSTPDEEQIKLAKSLASPDKEVRDSTVATLGLHLSSIDSMSELDMLRLWKALYYCMWLSDKVAIQEELAASLAKLSRHFKHKASLTLYFQIFYRTMLREWLTLDQHRIGKFYYLIRIMLRGSFTYLYDMKWATDVVSSMMSILDKEILQKTPNGLRFHIADIYIDELAIATEGKISTKNFIGCIEPFCKAIKSTNDQIFHDRIASSVFKKFLSVYATERKGAEAVESNSVGKKLFMFSSVKTNAIQKMVFDIASSEDIKENNRRKVYKIHKEFSSTTGKDFVEDDASVDANDDTLVFSSNGSAEEKPNSSDKKKNQKAAIVVDVAESSSIAPIKSAGKIDQGSSAPSKIPVKNSKAELKRKVIEPPAEVESLDASINDEGKSKSKKSKPVVTKSIETVEANGSADSVSGSSSASKQSTEPFIASKKFTGAKPGYAFQMGTKGLGYYLDAKRSAVNPRGQQSGGILKSKAATATAKRSETASKSVKFGKNKVVRF